MEFPEVICGFIRITVDGPGGTLLLVVREGAIWGRGGRCVLAGSLALALLGAMAAASPAEGAGPREPKVVCLTGWDPPTGAYRHKPRRCTLHKLGDSSFAQASTLWFRNAKWRHWGRRQARGIGRTGLSTVGPAKIWIRLFRARHRCGKLVFTRVRGTLRYRYGGQTYRQRYRMPITHCLA